jgi:flagellar basal body rod protein FlgG
VSDGIYIALNGALAESDKLDVVATNLANAATAGYQRSRPVFHAALAGAEAAYAGVTPEMELDTTRGAARVTGRALDATLPDATYLAVGTARGERYTRAGSLTVATDGTLQTRGGQPVLSDKDQRIQAATDKGDVSLSPNGDVLQDGEVLGRVKLVTFARPSKLSPEGGNTLAASVASGPPTASAGELEVGSVEESNTSVVGSMTELVSANRAFDAFQRAIDAFRDADHKVTSTVPDADQ